MFVQVAPLRRMPRALGVLDYSVPNIFDRVMPGQLVLVPFRNRIEPGMIISISDKTSVPKKIKTITELVSNEPFLSLQQIGFLQEISEMYATPLGFLIKNNLLPWKKTKISKLILKPLIKKNIFQPVSPAVYIYHDEKMRFEYAMSKFQNEYQNLWLLPTVMDVLKAEKALGSDLKVSTLFVTSDLTEKELFDAWVKIRQGEIKNVIGTRAALFLPWQNLRNIILDDEGNSNYKSWDMAPRFHTRDAALILCTHHQAMLNFMSHTPSVETLYFQKHKIYSGILEMRPLKPTVQIVNQGDERKTGNYDFWNEEMRSAIQSSAHEGDVFVFINRRGQSSYIGCRDCGYVVRCEKCNRSLTLHGSKNELQCHFCHLSYPQFVHCPDCHGVNVVMYSPGSELVENSARENWGSLFDIRRLDSDTTESVSIKNDVKNLFIVGTQLAWDKIDWRSIKIFIWLDFDAQLFIPEFQILENSWQMLRSAQYRLSETAQIFVQTNHPEHRLLQSLYDPIQYYYSEWSERKVLKYPPFAFLLRVYAGDVSQPTIISRSIQLYRNLAVLTQSNKDITISDPLEMVPEYFEGKHWRVIVIKLPYNFYKKYTKMIVGAVPEDWKVDPNPTTILNLS